MLRFRERFDHRIEDPANLLAGLFKLLRIGDAVFRQEFAGNAAGASRYAQCHGRVFIGTHGHFERSATDVQNEQASGIPSIPATSGKEGKPCLINAGQHGDRLADSLLDAAQNLAAVRRFAQCGGGKHEQLGDFILFGKLHRLLHGLEHGFNAGLSDSAIFLEVLHQADSALHTRLRLGPGSRGRINDKHVHRIRTDIEHAESCSVRA